jgi:hypothetical protein
MSEADLIQETNQLMRRILEIEDERKRQEERSRIELEEMQERIKARTEEAEEDDWEARIRESQEEAAKASLEMKEKDEMYKQQLMTELQTQSELLRRIAEKLGV